MSDIVERLRLEVSPAGLRDRSEELMNEAADELIRLRYDLTVMGGDLKRQADTISHLRAQLATAREGLRHIAANPTIGEGGMKWRARRTLAALDGTDTGGEDE